MNGPGSTIRKAEPRDYDGVVALWTRAGLHHRPLGRDSRTNLEREMADPRVDFLVAVAGSTIIGTVIGTNDGRKGWVNRLAVDPEHRGEGVAKQLVQRVEECFRARSLNIFSCLIEAANGPSQSLFEDLGYDRHPEVVYYSRRLGPDV